ncbi:hypothetical protein B0T19DRAFT_429107 [Cercophora scortea]|uniref:Uncharacterized protein n=1 Tax=Cercophora scortea TaxID=314031 RepID=A0AAE0IGH4_9PEZI|nr:hypothetical protein B0T19DRAFT_429107 [Cercophora scortea]
MYVGCFVVREKEKTTKRRRRRRKGVGRREWGFVLALFSFSLSGFSFFPFLFLSPQSGKRLIFTQRCGCLSFILIIFPVPVFIIKAGGLAMVIFIIALFIFTFTFCLPASLYNTVPYRPSVRPSVSSLGVKARQVRP